MQEQARNKYRELFNEAKHIKTEYGRNTYKNIPKEEKQKLRKYQKTLSDGNESIIYKKILYVV